MNKVTISMLCRNTDKRCQNKISGFFGWVPAALISDFLEKILNNFIIIEQGVKI